MSSKLGKKIVKSTCLSVAYLVLSCGLGMVLICELATAAADASSNAAAKPIHHTHPQPPKIQPTSPLHVFPAYEVPVNPESLVWKVSSKIAGQTTSATGNVPLCDIDSGGHAIPLSSITEGATINLTEFRRVGNILYYSVPWDGTTAANPKDAKTADGLPKKRLWISGAYIVAAGLAAPAK